jgi:hypothetical protein
LIVRIEVSDSERLSLRVIEKEKKDVPLRYLKLKEVPPLRYQKSKDFPHKTLFGAKILPPQGQKRKR